MTWFRLSTFRTGLLVSATGLGGLCLAAVTFVTAVVGDGSAERLRWCGPLAVGGLLLTVVGFATMNVGATRAGQSFDPVDPSRISRDRPRDEERATVDPERDGPRY